MVRHIKLAGIVAAFIVIFFTSFTLAQDINFSVSPAEVKIDNLPPGETAECELTIHNKDEIAHNFTITTFQPPEEERREGRAEFPNDSWLSFCSPGIYLPANSTVNVMVTVAIPQEQKWAGKDWETWLAVAAESSDLLGVKLYVRLLVSTSETRPNIGLVVGVIIAIVLFGYGCYYYFRRRTKPK